MLNRHPAGEGALIRTFTRPVPLVLALAICTFVPLMTAAVSVERIPLGA